MDNKEVKVEDIDELMTIDRKPVPLAFCALPTSTSVSNAPKAKNDDVEELLDLVDPIAVVNSTQVRKAPSMRSYGCDTESEYELSEDDSDFEDINKLGEGAQNSDEEFDRLTKYSAKVLEKTHKMEYPNENDGARRRKTKGCPKTHNVHEYDDLPPLDKLSIECKSRLMEFGFVSKVVDCMIVIVGVSTEVLDFDSYIFDEKGNSIGQVYDIFGQVKNPHYAIRFNTAEEASMIPIEMKVYYAPNEEKFSKTPFKGLNLAAANREAIHHLNRKLDHQDAVSKAGERIHADDLGDSDVEFSDDEAEKEYKNSKQSVQMVTRNGHDSIRGNGRKRDLRGQQRVRFAGDNHEQHRPYRRDFDAPMFSGPPNVFRPPQSTSTNPYAEFGCYEGVSKRFGF